MNSFIQLIDKSLTEINDSINEKINGTNYLEMLKFQLIEKIKENNNSVFKDLKKEIEKIKNFEKKNTIKDRNIKYSISFSQDSISRIKTKTKEDYLTLILEGSKNISIFDSSNESKYLQAFLHKNMGSVLSKNTTFSEKIEKNSIVMNIEIN